jgi:hypothetical protein
MHCNLSLVEDKHLYSTSDDDFDIVCCFFAVQEIHKDPKKKLDVDF